MGDNFMEKVSSFGERLKTEGAEVGRKMSAGMTSMSFKMKEFFQGQNMADQIVEEATAETLDEPDWPTNHEICDMFNHERINGVEVIRGIKNRIMSSSPRVQYLSLVLLETIVRNCAKAFSEVAAERVLDDMVKMIGDPRTIVNNRNKALMLIETWGESSAELRYLPMFEETYKGLKSRGVHFPPRDDDSLARLFTPQTSVSALKSNIDSRQQVHRDIPAQTFSAEQTKEAFDVARNSIELLATVLSSSPQQEVLEDELTTTLIYQCCFSRTTIQRIIDTAGDNEAVLFEALNVNDELHKVISKYVDMKKAHVVPREPDSVVLPEANVLDDLHRSGKEDALLRKPASSRGGVEVRTRDEMDDLDEMIFGKNSEGGSEDVQDPKKKQTSKDDMIRF